MVVDTKKRGGLLQTARRNKCFLLYDVLNRGFSPLYRNKPGLHDSYTATWQARSTKRSPSLQVSLSLLRNVGSAFKRHVVGPKGFGLLQGTLQLASNFSATRVKLKTEKSVKFIDTPCPLNSTTEE